jgi:integrase/recombinase XerD
MLARLALVGLLAGYSGPTRDWYRTDLRLFSAWLAERQVRLLDVHRTHIELYGRWLEEHGRTRSTIGRRLSTLAGFYRYCKQEQILERSPAAHVRRPKQDYESRTLGLDRNELGAFLVVAGLSSNRDHARASLLALNGLRISEALGADIEHLNGERGHRTLRIVCKGGKQVTIPLAPRTARAIDLAIGEREHGPIQLGGSGQRLDRYAATRIVKRARLSSGNHQADLAAQSAAQLHHRRVGRRCPSARRPGRRQPRRPSHHDAL